MNTNEHELNETEGQDRRKPRTQLIRNSTAEFLIFTAQSGGESIEVRYEDETIWLTQKLMATLFDVDVRTVSEHLGNIYDQCELRREATIRKFRTVQIEGERGEGVGGGRPSPRRQRIRQVSGHTGPAL